MAKTELDQIQEEVKDTLNALATHGDDINEEQAIAYKAKIEMLLQYARRWKDFKLDCSPPCSGLGKRFKRAITNQIRLFSCFNSTITFFEDEFFSTFTPQKNLNQLFLKVLNDLYEERKNILSLTRSVITTLTQVLEKNDEENKEELFQNIYMSISTIFDVCEEFIDDKTSENIEKKRSVSAQVQIIILLLKKLIHTAVKTENRVTLRLKFLELDLDLLLLDIKEYLPVNLFDIKISLDEINTLRNNLEESFSLLYEKLNLFKMATLTKKLKNEFQDIMDLFYDFFKKPLEYCSEKNLEFNNREQQEDYHSFIRSALFLYLALIDKAIEVDKILSETESFLVSGDISKNDYDLWVEKIERLQKIIILKLDYLICKFIFSLEYRPSAILDETNHLLEKINIFFVNAASSSIADTLYLLSTRTREHIVSLLPLLENPNKNLISIKINIDYYYINKNKDIEKRDIEYVKEELFQQAEKLSVPKDAFTFFREQAVSRDSISRCDIIQASNINLLIDKYCLILKDFQEINPQECIFLLQHHIVASWYMASLISKIKQCENPENDLLRLQQSLSTKEKENMSTIKHLLASLLSRSEDPNDIMKVSRAIIDFINKYENFYRNMPAALNNDKDFMENLLSVKEVTKELLSKVESPRANEYSHVLDLTLNEVQKLTSKNDGLFPHFS